MTVEEFAKLPDPLGARRSELFHGEIIEVSAPEHPHVRAQWQLRRRLDNAADDSGVVITEFPYRPLPEYECWFADVAYISKERWESIHRWLMGAPDLVVEVLSPSNRAAEIREKRKICLENGSREFWVVDQRAREVEVWTPDGRSVTYKSGQQILLFFAPGASIAVDDIFA